LAYKIIISDEVGIALSDYAAYISQRGNPENAMKWRDRMYDAMASLSEFPERMVIFLDARRKPTGYRYLIVDSHRIYYLIDEVNQTVVVTFIIHTALDS